MLNFFHFRDPDPGGFETSQPVASSWIAALRGYWRTAALAATNQVGNGPVFFLPGDEDEPCLDPAVFL